MIEDTKDYAQSGLTIRAALIDQHHRFPDKAKRPKHLMWAGLRVVTADSWQIPLSGMVSAQFLSSPSEVEQGFDLDVDGGFKLQSDEWVHPLRTWYDRRFKDRAEYAFRAIKGPLWVWNVYKMNYENGRTVEEKWTENAGMWVEELSNEERIYHCSPGMSVKPDFRSLVFSVKVSQTQ